MKRIHTDALQAGLVSLDSLFPHDYVAFLLNLMKSRHKIPDVLSRIENYTNMDKYSVGLKDSLENVDRPATFEWIYTAAKKTFEGKNRFRYDSVRELAQELDVKVSEITSFEGGIYRVKGKEIADLLLEKGIFLPEVIYHSETLVYRLIAKREGKPAIYLVEPNQDIQKAKVLWNYDIMLTPESLEEITDVFRRAVYTSFISALSRSNRAGVNLSDDIAVIEGLKSRHDLSNYLLIPPEDTPYISLQARIRMDRAFREKTGLTQNEIVQPYKEPVRF